MSFAIGIESGKDAKNIGGLWRSAYNFGASMIFTLGHRYKHDPTDPQKCTRQIPLLHFQDWADLRDHVPIGEWIPVVVELCEGAESLMTFKHPRNAIYILGPEDGSVSEDVQMRVKQKIVIPTRRCLNVAVTGAVVMYDRLCKS